MGFSLINGLKPDLAPVLLGNQIGFKEEEKPNPIALHCTALRRRLDEVTHAGLTPREKRSSKASAQGQDQVGKS